MDFISNIKDYVFFLGGHDLEMLEIKKILESQGVVFYDKNLQWKNAKLSQYSKELNDSNLFIGIELDSDIDLPSNYTLIDHHNENSYKPSAIEQVSEMFGIKLSRNQLLVAANDKGYIPAMEAMGATSDEIKYIRSCDREGQGVTEKDEQLGEQSIKESLTIDQGITLVKSLTTKFSAITDRLHPCDKLLVYTNSELTYYGEGVSLLIITFDNLIKQKKAYYGGGEKGYFEIGNKCLPIKELMKIKEEMISLLKHKLNNPMEPYSYHIFMFPFRWEPLSRKQQSFCERFNLNKIIPKSDSKWEIVSEPSEREKKIELYNEKNYFHSFVHPVLYNNPESENIDILHFEREEIKKNSLTYEIGIKNSLPYVLQLEEITLDLFATGTGVLIFHCLNNSNSKFADIKKINQYGRRVYPPFIGKENEIDDTKDSELADYIKISGLNADYERYKDNFSEYSVTDYWKPAKFINNLIDDLDSDLKVEPIIDDRMFTMCWTFNSEHSLLIEKRYEDYTKSDIWHEYLYVDSGKSTCQNDEMQKELLNNHTYLRWQKEGTLYGITRFSFMAISKDDWYPRNIIFPYFRTIYAKMVMLSLVQRATVLNFSAEVTRLSNINDNDVKSETIKLDTFYRAYVQFINKVYHREISAQDQGIELYDMLQENLRIEKHAKELEKEIKELCNYVNLLKTNQTGERMRMLTILTGSIVIPNLILNILNHRFFAKLPHIDRIGEYPFSADSIILITVVIICTSLIIIGILNLDKHVKLIVIKPKKKYANSHKKNNVNSPIIKNKIWQISGKIFFLIGAIILIIYLFLFQLFIGVIW